MSKKYEKITEMQLLKEYYEILNEYGIDYLSAIQLAKLLKTSKYQIYKAFDKLKELGYVKIDKYVIMPNHIHAIIIIKSNAAGASSCPTSL